MNKLIFISLFSFTRNVFKNVKYDIKDSSVHNKCPVLKKNEMIDVSGI